MFPMMAKPWMHCLMIHFDKMTNRELRSPYGAFECMLVGCDLGSYDGSVHDFNDGKPVGSLLAIIFR